MDPKELRKASEVFVNAHLRECAAELLEWSDTGVLRDGRVRELAKLCAQWTGPSNALNVAESYVKHAALEALVHPLDEPPSSLT
jgi:hypothetical protein